MACSGTVGDRDDEFAAGGFVPTLSPARVWVCLILTAACAAGLVFIGSVALSMYDSAEVDAVIGQLRSGVMPGDLQGDEMIVGTVAMGYGSFLSMIGFTATMPFVAFFASLVVVLQLSEDFETGFIKNVFGPRRGRGGYYAEKLLLILIVSLLFVVGSVCVTVVCRAIIDAFYTSVEPVAEIVAWFVFAWLTTSAYGLICAIVLWLTRSKALGILGTAFVSTGFLASMVAGAIGTMTDAAAQQAFQNWTLSGANGLLAKASDGLFAIGAGGLPPGVQILLTLALWYVVMLIVTFTACRSKDV